MKNGRILGIATLALAALPCLEPPHAQRWVARFQESAWTVKEIEGTKGKNGRRVAILAFAQGLVLLMEE